MNVVSINRKPQTLPSAPCPLCGSPARLMGRTSLPKDGRVSVWVSCAACKFSGEHEVDAPNGGAA